MRVNLVYIDLGMCDTLQYKESRVQIAIALRTHLLLRYM